MVYCPSCGKAITPNPNLGTYTMTKSAIDLSPITYGDFTIDPHAIPAKSLSALLGRGFAHFIGNEQSSKVVAHFRALAVADAVAANDGKPLDKEQRKAVESAVKLDPESEAYQKVKAEFQSAAIEAIASGTIGEALRGPRVDPLTAEITSIVKSEVIAKLVANGLHKGRKQPAGTDAWDFGDVRLTFDEMQARHMSKHQARVTKEAQAKLDALARKAKKAAEDAAKLAEGPKTAEALDF